MTNQLEGKNINKEGNASLPRVEGSEIMNSTQQSSDCSSSTCASSSVESASSVKKERQQYDYVKEIDEELSCPICNDPFIEPTIHGSCRSTFCSSCVENVPNCPNCREEEFKKNCSPCPNMIRNLLDKLEVKCGMSKNNVFRGELKDHQEKYCPLLEAYKQAEELKQKLQTDFQNNLEVLTQEFNEKIDYWRINMEN